MHPLDKGWRVRILKAEPCLVEGEIEGVAFGGAFDLSRALLLIPNPPKDGVQEAC